MHRLHKTRSVPKSAAISEWLAQHPTSRVHFAAFGSYDSNTPWSFFDGVIRELLDTGLRSVLGYHVGLCIVCCGELVDGLPVAVKLYPAGYELESVLEACREVQARMVSSSIPTPRPLTAGPTDLGLVTIDEYLPGERRECRSGQRRRRLAGLLATLVSQSPPAAECVELGASRLAKHPESVEVGETTPSEFADEVAGLLPAVQAADRDVVAHLDWRTQNVAWSGDDVVAVYDWDSVAITNEAIAVGCAAGMFSYDFRDGVPHVPSPGEVSGFIRDYRDVRSTISVDVAAAAAGLKMFGYAETERRLDPAGTRLGPRSYRSALSASFPEYVRAFSGDDL